MAKDSGAPHAGDARATFPQKRGDRIVADEKTQSPGGGQVAAPSGSFKKRILFVVIGLVLVGGAGFGGFLAARKMAPQKTESVADKTANELAEDAEKGVSKEKSEGKSEAKPEGEDKKEAKGKKEGEKEGEASEGLNFHLQPIGTNLNEDSVRRAVQVSFVLQMSDEEALAKVKEEEAHIRSAIIILLGTKTMAELRLADGKELLAEQVKTLVSQVVGQGKVEEVLYDGFVLQ
jgi:flagellar FliL protein